MPMQFLQEQGYEITFLPVDEKGHISLEDLEHAIREDTILVSVMMVNECDPKRVSRSRRQERCSKKECGDPGSM